MSCRNCFKCIKKEASTMADEKIDIGDETNTLLMEF
jgi:hypothetical protein